jgi:hypothetical protein
VVAELVDLLEEVEGWEW